MNHASPSQMYFSSLTSMLTFAQLVTDKLGLVQTLFVTFSQGVMA